MYTLSLHDALPISVFARNGWIWPYSAERFDSPSTAPLRVAAFGRDDRGGVAGRFALAARGRGLYDASSPPPGGRRGLQSPVPAGPVRSRPDRSPDPGNSERDGGL